jgi:hypothetical protein
MTGPENYQMAQDLLARADEYDDQDALSLRAAALVHAQLALAAATALSTYHTTGGLPEPDNQAWYRVASEGPGAKARRKADEAAELAEYNQDIPATPGQED